MPDFKIVQESPEDIAEPFYGNCPTHNRSYTFIWGSAHDWVRLENGTHISQPEHFRREGVCCWSGLYARDRASVKA